MELSNIEPVAQSLFGFFSQAEDLDLPGLVCERLGGPGDVSVHLVYDVVLREGSVLNHKVNRTPATPLLRMHPRVHN
jgi:hypothetical protein